MDDTNPPDPGSDREDEVVPFNDPEDTQEDPAGQDREPLDPETAELWHMSIGDLEKILDDETHPLHEKAKAVSAEIFKPMREALSNLAGPHGIMESISKQLTFKVPKVTGPLIPPIKIPSAAKIKNSWVSANVPSYPAWQSLRQTLPEPSRAAPPSKSGVNFDIAEVPTATVAEVARAADLEAQEIRIQQVSLLTKLLESAQAEALSGAKALEVAKSGRAAGWWAAGAAIAAALIAIAGIIVTVAVSN